MITSEVLRIPNPDKLFIGGEWVAPATDKRVPTINPFNEEQVASLPAPSPADADRAVTAARKAFDEGTWRWMPIEERIAILERFTKNVERRFDEIGVAWTFETGSTVAHRDRMAVVAKNGWEAIMGAAAEVEFEEIRETALDGRAAISREPIGVVLAIMTYNGPLTQLGKKVIAALVVGCSVIAKLAPETDLVGRLLAEAADDSDLPPGLLTIMTGDAVVAGHLTAHPGVDMVTFTGGTEVGSKVLNACSGRIAKCALELGGKSAAIVADDFDLDRSITAILGGMMPFQGQICTTRSRLLVSEKRHDELVDAVVAGFQARTMGDPSDPATTWGPMAAERVRSRAERFVESGVAEGARIATGGRRPSDIDRGWFYEPTLFVDVDNSMTVAQEEVFGPVYCVIKYRDIDDAVRIANDSRFGLAGSVYTNDADLARSVSRRVRAGSFAINGSGVALTQPFGGMKSSGIGREGGLEGLLEYTEVKTTTL